MENADSYHTSWRFLLHLMGLSTKTSLSGSVTRSKSQRLDSSTGCRLPLKMFILRCIHGSSMRISKIGENDIGCSGQSRQVSINICSIDYIIIYLFIIFVYFSPMYKEKSRLGTSMDII